MDDGNLHIYPGQYQHNTRDNSLWAVYFHSICLVSIFEQDTKLYLTLGILLLLFLFCCLLFHYQFGAK